MRWTTKARIQRTCARLPRGDAAYRILQRRFGTLDADPCDRLLHVGAMLAWLDAADCPIEGAHVVEVGTGHKPTLPVAFHLAGAGRVTTVDLHRRLQPDLVTGLISWMAEHSDDVTGALRPGGARPDVKARLSALGLHAHDATAALVAAGIEYLAPADATALPLADGSVDVHLSTTVLEHVEPAALDGILEETRRVLRPGGVALHFIDLSDHFAHHDPEITAVNFLRFEPDRWERLAGNEFGYCNRLRRQDYRKAFAAAGLRIVRDESTVDERSVADLAAGLPLVSPFSALPPDEVACTQLNVLAVPA